MRYAAAIAIIQLFVRIAVSVATAGSLLSLGKTDESAAAIAGLWYFGIESLKNKTDFKSSNYVVGIFVLGKKEIGEDFIKAIISDMKSCIVIDDIGEGLDYERSAAIIKVLIEKAQTGLVQLIMTTNDEFIMNGVPLEYWSVIERKPGSAKLHNMANSADKFKQFQFIGLNNFDFFTSEFVLQEELDIEEE